MTGSASIVRNGVTIVLNNGDAVYQTDVVQTGSNSTLGLVLVDGTTFNLTANARLMLNDLTYDPTSTSNTALFTLVQGAASFVAGQVAKTGDMKVGTPVAAIGIRGTAVILDISSTDGTVGDFGRRSAGRPGSCRSGLSTGCPVRRCDRNSYQQWTVADADSRGQLSGCGTREQQDRPPRSGRNLMLSSRF